MCNDINPCSCNEQEINCSPCEQTKACPINLDTSCIFYNFYTDTTNLNCLSLSNGVSLTEILEAIDTKLCQNLPSIPAYNLPCLRNDYIVNNFQQFAEAVDEELCTVRVELENLININKNNISSLSTLVSSIYNPAISDCGSIGLVAGDSIITILQKYANTINGYSNGFFQDLQNTTYDLTVGGIRKWDFVTNPLAVTNSIVSGASSSLSTATTWSGLQQVYMDTQYDFKINC